MARCCILLMDSFGIGASLDAKQFGDEGANTLGHIAEHCFEQHQKGHRAQCLQIPNLVSKGLARAFVASSGTPLAGIPHAEEPLGLHGYAVEQSFGKDTPSGHWEIAGVPARFDWGYFPASYPSFPQALIEDWLQRTGLPGVLGNKHASGTEIIEALGQEHLDSGKPIVYTSADSVFQVAAHEQAFGLERLYEICQVARELVDEYNIGRVIARPFVGQHGDFQRTANRRDYATPPPKETLLDSLKKQGHEVLAIGKIADIYAHRGITQTIKGDGNMDLFDKTLSAMEEAPSGALVFTNFVDFDSKYGHRRNIEGYAQALEAFDKRLPELDARLQTDDIVVIAADHGCDPSFPGSDHTREHIPVLVYGPKLKGRFIGRRDSFADIGQSIAQHLGIDALAEGISFLNFS